MGQEVSQCVEDMTSNFTDITENASKEDGEVAAGYLFHKPRQIHMKRAWFVLRGWPESSLYIYKDRVACSPIAAIQLLRGSVQTKEREDNRFHFQIHHSCRGTKHLYSERHGEMTRWVQEIKNVMNEATSLGGIEGNLNKRGGLRLQTWQSRWPSRGLARPGMHGRQDAEVLSGWRKPAGQSVHAGAF